ncbi:hypothetical protein F2Q68_00039309 [Brassica cretica]|uniref:Uncharacterized protein n=1 Tax=Brassica cretica TaxID=69181 RepID=A0A8S9ML26_BRACR|nr:hypothetical protein F2Q68_00039309 [Brassica cretica]
MSSSSNFQKSCDVEMADAAGASSSAPPATGEVPAHIVEFCSFQRELARCDAEGTVKPTRSVSLRPVVPVDALTPEVPRVCDTVPSGGVVAMDVSTPKVEIQPSGSSMTPIRVVDVEPAQESMPPPPAKRVIVLGLPAPSATLAAVPKSRKRPSANPDAAKRKRCTEAGPLPTMASGSGLSSRHHAKREDYELSSRNLTLGELLVFDTMPKDVRDQCAEFRVRPRSNHGFRRCDDYFDLRFPYRFQPDSVPL